MGFRAGALRAPTHPEPSRGEGAALGAQKVGGGEDFQSLQLLVPRHCSTACPQPLFYLQMPFYLCCYCCSGKIPFTDDRREGSAASCTACAFPRPPAEQKLSRWHKTLPPCVRGSPPLPSPVPNLACPWAAGASPADAGTVGVSQLMEERGEISAPGEAEPVRKALIRLHPNPVGWRLAGRQGQSKQEAPACREVPAACLRCPSRCSCSWWRQQREKRSLLCGTGLAREVTGLWK